MTSGHLSRRGFCVLLGASSTLLLGSAHRVHAGVRNASEDAIDEEGEKDWAFASPPEHARPYVLWMWMGCNISAEGITADLEAMKDAGIGGATIFSLADTVIPWAGTIAKSPTPDIIAFTEPWWKLVRHAAVEAHRLGLELILHNCAGYESSGGPWITPELSMQELVWSVTPISGGRPIQATLKRPVVDDHPHANFPQIFMEELDRVAVPTVPARRDYFRDIAVIALPATGVASTEQAIVVTTDLDSGGSLTWNAPAGDWILYRFGHTTTGAMIQPAQRRAMGLECDKMSHEAVAFHVSHVLSEMKAHLGDMMGKGVTTLYFDSYEAGTPNWTPKMREEFRTRRGYDILQWLPVFAGRTIGSEPETAHFKHDFQRTTFDLFRDCYWKTPGPLAHAAGLKFGAEPYDGPWEISEVVGFLDTPTVEFWTHKGVYSPVSARPVIDKAHKLGRSLIAAESFTGAPDESRWNEHPAWLKSIGDAAFCGGINRLNLHHFVHQPWDSRYRPGNAMGQWGTHFGRNQTWWKPGKAWIKYLWRCQNLLQRGVFVEPSAASALTVLDVRAEPEAAAGKPHIQSIRRNLGDASVFFVANTERAAGSASIQVPIAGLQPELWDPVWGTITNIDEFEQTASATTLRLEFAESQSFFLVFRRPARRKLQRPATGWKQVTTLDGSWEVRFDPAWGGPASITFPELIDWTHHAEPGIRYYSGTAVYRKQFYLDHPAPATGLWLDLGACHHLAHVTLNGNDAGVLWTAPWRVDLGSHGRPGRNILEIAVTNVWANRLIGDEKQPPDVIWRVGEPSFHSGDFLKEFPDWFLKHQPRPSAGRYTFTTWNYFKPDSALTPSGLLGPVRLMQKLD